MTITASHLNAEHPVELTKVGNFNMLAKAHLEGFDGAGAAGGDGAIIHMNGNDDEGARGLGVLEEDCLVDFALHEAK